MFYIVLIAAVTTCVVLATMWRNDHAVMSYEIQQLKFSLATEKDASASYLCSRDACEEVVKGLQLEVADLEAKLVEANRPAKKWSKRNG